MTLTVPGLKYFSRWFGKLTINSTIQHHQKLLQNPVSLGPCIFSLAFGFLALAELIWLSLGMGTSFQAQVYAYRVIENMPVSQLLDSNALCFHQSLTVRCTCITFSLCSALYIDDLLQSFMWHICILFVRSEIGTDIKTCF